MCSHIRILCQRREHPKYPEIPPKKYPDLQEYPLDCGGYPTESESVWPALKVYPDYLEIFDEF